MLRRKDQVGPNGRATRKVSYLMMLDRYVKTVLTVIAIALVVIALNPWLTPVRALLGPRHAAGETAQAKYEYTIPKAWGKVVPYSNGNLLAEAPDGTWREIDLRGKPPEYPKVIVQMKFN